MNERGRVPFALVGVLLLASSVTLTTVGTYEPHGQPSIDEAMEGATAESVTELRGAADDAATRTATAPTTRPANTTAGRALNDSHPVRDALRLRLYLAARDRLDGVEVRRGEVVATASLPPVEPTTDGYRAAIDRVDVQRAGTDGAGLRVEIEGLSLTATRDGRTVSTVERTPSFVIAHPVLLLHDQTVRFEDRASAPVTEAGLGQRLTERLYPVAWARGYAQYGGAPISTVVGTRHVELAANDALLAEQQTVFGASDPAGDRGVAAAARRVATTDLLVGAGADEDWTDVVLDSADDVGPDPPVDQPVGTWVETPRDPDVTVGINRSADRTYADLVGVGTTDDLSALIDRVHTVEARLVTSVDELGASRRAGASPGSSWSFVDETTSRTVRTAEIDGPAPPGADGWTTRESAVFDVIETETTTKTWKRDEETKTTESIEEREYRVTVTVQARTVPIDDVPAGDLDGTLEDATVDATERVIRDVGSLRAAARVAVTDDVSSSKIATAQPTVTRDRLEADLRSIRDRTRDVSVTLPASAVGTGRANPPERLRAELTVRRADFRGETGSSATIRTYLAARTAYLDALDDHLERRADRHAQTSSGIDDHVGEHLDTDRLDGALAAHRMAARPEPKRYTDPAGNVSVSVDTGPSYLPTSQVSLDRIDARADGAYHPLATRNVNVFTSPHGQVAESLVDRLPLLGDDGVALSTAGETLAAMDERPAAERQQLESEVESAIDYVRRALVAALADEGIPRDDAREAIDSASSDSTASEAIALANGTVIDPAAEMLGDDETTRDRLRLRMELELTEALDDDSARPSRSTTSAAAEAAQSGYRDELERVVADGVESTGERARKRALGERLGALPAGLPLAPVPGYWYATANVWYVDVGGTYERFALRSDRGGPTGATTYLREGQSATLHHEGERQYLGDAERVSFRTETAVVVVVPPGGRGVGDTDGVVDERSPGWPP